MKNGNQSNTITCLAVGGILMLAAFMCGCALQPPVNVSHVQSYVNRTRGYQKYMASDWRFIKEGERGNCAAYAYTKQQLLGYGDIKVCKLSDGTRHAFLMADGWALDNRFIAPVRIEEVGCIGKILNVKGNKND